ncbi:MAG: transketolase C-terminal domain-containing protein, partial [Acidimicrobiia bacterium]
TKSGIDIYVVKGWDYPSLCIAYVSAIERVRTEHIPALFHITEMTQPQGHSTSGSHERYKSKERLEWEEKSDCIQWLRNWIIENRMASEAEIDELEAEDRRIVESARKEAWQSLMDPIRREQADALTLMRRASEEAPSETLNAAITDLRDPLSLNRRVIASSLMSALFALRAHESEAKTELARFAERYREEKKELYRSFTFSRSPESPLEVEEVKPVFSDNSETVDGRVVLLRCFDKMLERDPRVFAVGEDIGKLGDVNLVFEGLNEKYGELRVTDTGIREASILGQGIGAAMRGLRPIVDIQYLDYLMFAIQGMSDDLATLHYRTHGGQKAPVIIRTKGHRLEGIWHTGSPMGTVLHSCRGIYICVPRDMTRAAGMYNTLLKGDNPALVVEVLSGYRLKERVPDNIGEFTVPLGVPDVIREGTDITIVTYGFCCRVATEAAYDLAAMGIEAEVIDVQTLSP